MVDEEREIEEVDVTKTFRTQTSQCSVHGIGMSFVLLTIIMYGLDHLGM